MSTTRCSTCAGFTKIGADVTAGFKQLNFKARMCARVKGASTCSAPRASTKARATATPSTSQRTPAPEPRDSVLEPDTKMVEDFNRAADMIGGVSTLAKRLDIGRHVAERIAHGLPTSKTNLFVAAASLDAWARNIALPGFHLGNAARLDARLSALGGNQGLSPNLRARLVSDIETEAQKNRVMPASYVPRERAPHIDRRKHSLPPVTQAEASRLLAKRRGAD